MIKSFPFIIFFLFLILFSCFSQQKTKLIVFDLDSTSKEISQDEIITLSDFIRSSFISIGTFEVISREELNKILKEYEFQLSGLTDESTAIRLGKMFNAEHAIIGTIGIFGKTYIINIKLLNIETGEYLKAESIQSDSKENILKQIIEKINIICNNKTKDVEEHIFTDFTSPTIITNNMSIYTHHSFVWNSYYKIWRIEESGGGFSGTFTVQLPGLYKLIVTHLSSSAASCRGGGYSPVTIKVNDKNIVSNYDVAANHDASHGWITDSWTINAVAGVNSIQWIAQKLCTHYWIQSIQIVHEN